MAEYHAGQAGPARRELTRRDQAAMLRRALPLAITAAAAAAVLLGCASQARHEQAAFTALEHALPGVYDNGAQSATTSGAVLPVTLSIVPAPAQVIGDNVFFVRETAADNSQLVLSQSVWTLTVEPKAARIVQRSYLLKDPRRWSGAAQHPDLLLSMLPEDLQPLPSCDLVWTQSATGFEASGAPPPSPGKHPAHARAVHRGSGAGGSGAAAAAGGCRPGPQAQGLWIEQGAQLSGRQLTLTERRTTAAGALDGTGAPLSLVLERGASADTGSPAASPGTVPANEPGH